LASYLALAADDTPGRGLTMVVALPSALPGDDEQRHEHKKTE
jgi:hypothetical protein